MEEVLIPLIVFGSMFAVVYVFLTTRNKERLALIEKGADATLFKSGPGKSVFGVVVLNIALLAIGIGIGVLLGSLLEMSGMEEEIAMPAMIFICGGLGLLAGFFATRKFKDDNKE
ncbi:MAG: hypothetical protein KAI99_14755 [Cyclobacteriaceae bacterium]|nr:hypothetical protein [Cyclobacteriaceae bacterium]